MSLLCIRQYPIVSAGLYYS